MGRSRVLLITAALVFASVLTWGQMRSVYYNGAIHKMGFLNETNYGTHIYHASGTVSEDNWIVTWNTPDALVSSGGYVSYLGFYSGGPTLFGGQFFFPYVVDTDPYVTDKVRQARVAVYDPDSGILTTMAIENTDVPPSDDYCGAGVAMAVLGETLYLFTDRATWSTGDGITWSKCADSILTHGMRLEPMDAITFMPQGPDPEHVLIFCHAWQYGYETAFIWNGKWGADKSVLRHDYNSADDTSWAVALYQGSAGELASGGGSGQGTSFIKGDRQKGDCIQIVTGGTHSGASTLYRKEVCFDANGTPTWGSRSNAEGKCIKDYTTAPWFKQECTGPNPDDPNTKCAIHQFFVVNYENTCRSEAEGPESSSVVHFAVKSDYLVPMYRDTAPNGHGWQGYLTDTQSPPEGDEDALWGNWHLLGIIAGPAPFSTNGITNLATLQNLSKVIFATTDTGTTTSTTTYENSVLGGVRGSIKYGFQLVGWDRYAPKAKDPKNYWTLSADLSFKNAWKHIEGDRLTTTHTIATTVGTQSESENWGSDGWAVFEAPSLLGQEYHIYAYDYDISTGLGKDVDRFQLTTKMVGTSLLTIQFPLSDPANAPGHEGLLTGMRAFPNSQNLQAWVDETFEFPATEKKPWEVLWGSGYFGGDVAQILTQGALHQDSFDSNIQHFHGDGSTKSLHFGVGADFQRTSHYRGFSVGLLSAYDGYYSTFTQYDMTHANNMQYYYNVPTLGSSCTDPSVCYKDIEVQPIMLLATGETDWTPTRYNSQLPWLMTWEVESFERSDGTKVKRAPPPAGASAVINGGTGVGEEGSSEGSHYAVDGGVLAWLNTDGSVTPIPMTSDQFEPARGAVVKLNGHAYEAVPANGKWKRDGQVWKFQTKDSVKHDKFTLALNFKSQTWKFEARKADLALALRAGEETVRLDLAVNGRYGFYCDVDHDTDHHWILKAPKGDQSALELRKFKGHYDPESGKGTIGLEGTLPDELPGFGDMSFIFNGHRRDFPLHLLPDFEKAMEKGKELICKVDEAKLVVNLGNGTWSLSLDENLHRGMAPQSGQLDMRIHVGGTSWYSERHPIVNFTTEMKYKG